MDYYKVGTIVNTQGLQGEVRIISVTDFADERYKKGSKLALFDKNDNFVRDLEVKSHRKQKNFDIVKFVDLYHINEVEKFRDFTVKVAQEELSDLDDGEFYYHEIIGLPVYEDDDLIGNIKEILSPGANDVWVIKRPKKKDLLIPYIPSVVLDIDLENGKVSVEIPEGLDDED
jgi:16S rRNA processing protein RimM